MNQIDKTQVAALAISVFLPMLVLYGDIKYSGTLNAEGSNIQIDLNGDGLTDIGYKWFFMGGGSGTSTSAYKPTYSTNYNVRCIYNTFINPYGGGIRPGCRQPLVANTPIYKNVPETTLVWSYGGYEEALLWTTFSFETGAIHSGPWSNQSNMFMGVEISVDTNKYYGYVQLSVDEENHVTLVDYAIEQNPNTPILCGDTPPPSVKISMGNAEQFTLAVSSIKAGDTYLIQCSTNLTDPMGWINVSTLNSDTHSTNITENITDVTSAFYRIIKD